MVGTDDAAPATEEDDSDKARPEDEKTGPAKTSD
jgi:hypothetical protein